MIALIALSDIQKALHYVSPFYDSPLRYYHNRSHVARMINAACDLNEDGIITEEELFKLSYAIIFHDVIQHPCNSDASNEFLSGRVYKDYCSKNYIEFDSEVVKLIRSTQFHFDKDYTPEDGLECNPKDKLVLYMMDLDLLSFTDDYDEFCQTNHDIDNEYRPFFDEETLKTKRKEFLKNIFDDKLLKFRIMDTDGAMTRKAYNNLEQYIMENYE